LEKNRSGALFQDGDASQFPQSPILGKTVGKSDEKMRVSVGGVLTDPPQQTVPRDSKSTLRIIPFAVRFIPVGKTSACTRAIKAAHTFWL
jgi:hypothetical protein